MPLSEHEQRLLEQMERALYAEDPKFAHQLRGADPRTHHRRRVLKASVGFIAGIALLLTGVQIPNVAVSVVGFLFMLASTFFALSSLRQLPSADAGAAAAAAAATPAGAPGGAAPAGKSRPRPASGRRGKVRGGGSFMHRMEERWQRRRDDNGR